MEKNQERKGIGRGSENNLQVKKYADALFGDDDVANDLPIPGCIARPSSPTDKFLKEDLQKGLAHKLQFTLDADHNKKIKEGGAV